MTFRTRVSVLLVLLVSLPALFSLFMAYVIGDIEELVTLVYLPIVLPLLFCTRYTIDEDKLYVKAMPFLKGQPYDLMKLESITPTRTILSAPASSLKRIKLNFGCGDALVISPASQDLFIEEILRVNPNVKVNL